MNLTVIEGKRKLIIQAPRIEEDVPKWKDIIQMNMDEFMHVQIQADCISYSCPKFISLAKRLENPINEFDFHMIIAQIARAYKVAHHIGLTSENVVWNPEYVFMSPTTREMKFILLLHKEENDTTFQSLLEETIYSVKQSNIDDSYVSEFVYHLKRFESFDYQDILSYIAEFDSKVTRLLQLKKPISYEMPKREMAVSDFQMVDDIKDEMEEETNVEEVVSEEVEEIVPEEMAQETEETVQEEAVEPEEVIEAEEIEESVAEDTVEEKKPTKLSFVDMFTEGSQDLVRDEGNDYFDDLEVSSKYSFKDMDSSMDTDPKDAFPVEFCLIRESTQEIIPIDKKEYFLGKSSYIDGYSVKGNPAVSRKHALIKKEKDAYTIQDLGSVNGTYINQEQVESQKTVEIQDGDIIELGNEKFTFKRKSNED